MDKPGFSVVIPLFNKRDYVAATLASVLAQDLPPREVIVVDNGSSDGGDALVEALGHPLVRLLREDQRGPGPARNRGIAAASGEWIAFVDADDLWASDHLARLADVAARFADVPLVASGFTTGGADAAPPPSAGSGQARLVDFYHGGNADLVWTSAVAVRREALLDSGAFAPFPTGEDTDLWIRLALTGPFAVTEAITALYRRDNAGIMDQAQAALARSAPPPSPVFATIAALLADPRHAARHGALAAYGDGLRCRFAAQLVYNGHPAAARALLRPCTRRSGAWWLWWLASLVPPALLRPLARLWSARPRR